LTALPSMVESNWKSSAHTKPGASACTGGTFDVCQKQRHRQKPAHAKIAPVHQRRVAWIDLAHASQHPAPTSRNISENTLRGIGQPALHARRARHTHHGRRFHAQAEDHLRPHREGDRTGSRSHPTQCMGRTESPCPACDNPTPSRRSRVRRPQRSARRRGSADLGGLHGRTTRSPPRTTSPPETSTKPDFYHCGGFCDFVGL
jgi:hypothetical protein